MNRSSTSSWTRSGSAPGRSILLMTTIGVRPSASALRSTKRVCGIGPSNASTTSSTPSTMRRMRSTSPPKSACPGRVDDVDLGAVPADGGVLGEDRDAALALERVRVHHALLHDLIIAKRARLAEHLVHERRLAVIDVRDDSDVTDLHSLVSIATCGRSNPRTSRRGHGRSTPSDRARRLERSNPCVTAARRTHNAWEGTNPVGQVVRTRQTQEVAP